MDSSHYPKPFDQEETPFNLVQIQKMLQFQTKALGSTTCPFTSAGVSPKRPFVSDYQSNGEIVEQKLKTPHNKLCSSLTMQVIE